MSFYTIWLITILSIFFFVVLARDYAKEKELWDETWVMNLGMGLAWCFGFKERFRKQSRE